jgi:ubiquinol-cytochrome c reductase cytochrome c subunit
VADAHPPDASSASRGQHWQAIGGWLALAVVAGGTFLLLQPGAGGSAVLAAGGGSGVGARPGAGGGELSSAAVTEAGRALYTAQCASCHGQQGEGTGNGPTLVGAGAAGADFYLRTGRMPLSAPGQPVTRHPQRLSEEQIAALVDVVAGFGPGPEIPQVLGGGDVGDGARLYLANCAACHGATGAGNAIGGGAIAANLGHASALDILEAIRIGPGAMPNFELSPEDEASIVAYVHDLQTRPDPGGLAIGGLGAVAEGFIAIAVGLVLLVLIAMFAGRRSHVGEPPTTPVG